MFKKCIFIVLIVLLLIPYPIQSENYSAIQHNMVYVSTHLSTTRIDEAQRERRLYRDCKFSNLRVLTYIYYDGERSIVVALGNRVVAALDTRSGDFVLLEHGRWIGRLQSVVSRHVVGCQ